MALLLPDPCDPRCPDAFKEEARAILTEVRKPPANDAEMRKVLLWFIGAFANWDLAGHPTYVRVAQNLVRAAHSEEAPLVVDPFAGGGSIPLEALRLGCEAFASDLNPVACLILKVMLEDIPRHGPQLANELRRAGGEVRERAERKLASLYPVDPDDAKPIAYLWARTVRCESPTCGAEIPLMRSFWLCKKPKRKWALRPMIIRDDKRKDGSTPYVEFNIFEPKADGEVETGTVARAKATCLCCGTVLPPDRVRAQLAAQRGGADAVFDGQGKRVGGARITAVVTLRPGMRGRHYRLPTAADYAAVRTAQQRLQGILEEGELTGNRCPVPDEPLPPIGTLGFRVQRYGMLQWGELFTARQKTALLEFCRSIEDIRHANRAVAYLLALTLGKVADFNCSLARWRPSNEDVGNLFGRQAIPLTWDFVETDPTGSAYVGLERSTDHVVDVTRRLSSALTNLGQVQSADATESPLPDSAASTWFTDPPYYDAIPYADLSDFFLVWLKRSLPEDPLLRNPFDPDDPLTPKAREAVQDKTKQVDGRSKDREWFEETMAKAFAEGRRVLQADGVGSVVFAHKTTEGWEALLSGMIRGGWTITGSWPIATEMASRLRSRNSAALATSIHLVCRPRPEDASVGDWADVLRELPQRVGDWMERLQGEGIRGADLVFACIGPALEVFSRYRRVETPDGTTVGLPEYLEKVWEVVGRTALENVLGSEEAKARNGLAGALEEDSRLTALFLWTVQATAPADEGVGKKRRGEAGTDEAGTVGAKGYSLAFDVVRRFAQPLGIDLPKWEKRIVETKKGVVRLLPIAERAKRLFGSSGAEEFANRMEQPGASAQLDLLPAAQVSERELATTRGGRRSRGSSSNRVEASTDATTLDRVHTAMLLQAGGRTQALRNLVAAERERGPDFERLANALSALYPRGSEEKRLLDAMLLAAPR